MKAVCKVHRERSRPQDGCGRELKSWYRRFGKRGLDVVLATIAVVFLLPVVLVIAVAILVTMGPPVIFRQVRPGLHGKPFVMYKFCTMLDLRDEQGNLLPDEKRLTKSGKFLRRFSLDEIPELWNVLKGDMSVVAPRPLLMEYLPLYTSGTGPATRGEARYSRTGDHERQKHPQLGGEIQTRRLVRRQRKFLGGLKNLVPNLLQGGERRRHKSPGIRNHAQV